MGVSPMSVEQPCDDGRNCSEAEEREDAADEVLVVPPEGVEHEAGADGFGDDHGIEEYFSCSDESEDEDAELNARSLHAPSGKNRTSSGPSKPRRSSSSAGGSSPSSGAGGRGKVDKVAHGDCIVAAYEERQKALPRGLGDHIWTTADEANFDIRAASYLRDRKKERAGPSMLELVSID